MEGTIEEILAADPHIVRIETPDYAFPARDELDPKKIKPEWARREKEWQYVDITNILTRPIIVDNFAPTHEGHEERTAWKQYFIDTEREDVYEFLQSNLLRTAVILPTVVAIQYMARNYLGEESDEFHEQVNGCVTYFKEDMLNYNLEPTETKVEMVKELQKRIHEALSLVVG